MSIQRNYENVQARIKEAALRSGRSEDSVELLAVTKYVSEAEIREIIKAGANLLGESRTQQALPRVEKFSEVSWHFIGNLQTNKAKFCQNFDLIHSVDRWSLAKTLNRWAGRWDKLQSILIQVNVSGEESKSGLSPEKALAFVEKVSSECPNLQIRGLMTMAPLIPAEETRLYFRETKTLYDEIQQKLGLNWDILSMGMTNDFEVAIEEGSTLVRIGSALFAKEDENE